MSDGGRQSTARKAWAMRATESINKARIIIVDDEPANVRLLERILERAGYAQLLGITDPGQAIHEYSGYQPDLVILDLMMPQMDGFGVMHELSKKIPEGTYIPILVLTADTPRQSRERALSMGASDFLTKPFDQTEVLLRIRNLLQIRAMHLKLLDQNAVLEEKVRQRTWELEQSLDALQRTSEQRRILLSRIAEAQLDRLTLDAGEGG
jgi:DNA-binding response OmpR family regulator